MRVLLVIHRFGREIIGGAERLALEYARRLALRHELVVATTCAQDYRTWRNGFAPGESEEAGVEGSRFVVRRFAVARRRHQIVFGPLSRLAFRFPAHRGLARRWMREQGPAAPALVAWVAAEARSFDAVLLFNYLYYPTYQCLPHCADRALLVPLAHDEPPLRLFEYREVFTRPRGLLVSSRTEEALIRARFGATSLPPMHYGGAGVEIDADGDADAGDCVGDGAGRGSVVDDVWLALQTPALRDAVASCRYVLSAGRIAEAKDAHLLAADFAAASGGDEGALPLLLVGPLEMSRSLLPNHRRVIVASSPAPEGVLRRLRRGALATLHASRHESLNLAAIESLAAGTPILVHERSHATLEILGESGCGARWSSPAELAVHLAMLARQSFEERNAAAARATAFARQRYAWAPTILRVESALEAVAAHTSPAATAPASVPCS